MNDTGKPVILDLFCGCSGLGLGARAAGFEVALSVDLDGTLTSSHKLNFPQGQLMLMDVRDVGLSTIARTVDRPIDGIVGGPPCQGFSSIGKAQVDDPRRELLWHFFRVVKEVQPKFFMMENVRGLTFSKNRPLLDMALTQVTQQYEIVGPIEFDVADFGGATKRPRVFVFGYNRDYVDKFDAAEMKKFETRPTTVREAIGDLRNASQSLDVEGFDQWKLASEIEISAYAANLRALDGLTTGMRKTPHRPDVVARFAALKQGETDRIGRHPRLSWDKQCPTLRAGTGADKGSFQAVRPIHPEEPRVITVREAARLQGFPDWFRFHPTVWHSFRMIGNSVSPVLAQAALEMIKSKMSFNRESSDLRWIA